MQIRKRFNLLAFFLLASLLLLPAGCSAAPTQTADASPTSVEPVSESTQAPAAVQAEAAAASSTPAQAEPLPASFPLAGSWAGTALNGDIEFEVSVTIHTACSIGADCGTFDIPLVPCAGSYVLMGVENDVYEFETRDKSAACGEGKDYLQLLPDGMLKFISRGDYGVNEGVLSKTAGAGSSAAQLPVIFDDDGSPDGTTALLYLLSEPAARVEAVIISHGEAHPQVYIQHMGRMLEDFGISGIPLGAGLDEALQPGEDFPEWLRQSSDNFWGFPVPHAEKTYPAADAAELMVSLINQTTEPIAVFVSGPATDLAAALRLDAGIREHISAVYMMGGAVYVPGNLTDFSENPANVSAEWNIYIDPVAADEVFSAGVPLVLVPLDATNQVSAAMGDTRQWRAGGRAAIFAADMYDMLLGGSETAQMGLWDVMTAVIMVHPELCPLVPLNIRVVTAQGDTYGQTLALEEGQPNARVCLAPDVEGIKQTLAEVFAGGGGK